MPQAKTAWWQLETTVRSTRLTVSPGRILSPQRGWAVSPIPQRWTFSWAAVEEFLLVRTQVQMASRGSSTSTHSHPIAAPWNGFPTSIYLWVLAMLESFCPWTVMNSCMFLCPELPRSMALNTFRNGVWCLWLEITHNKPQPQNASTSSSWSLCARFRLGRNCRAFRYPAGRIPCSELSAQVLMSWSHYRFRQRLLSKARWYPWRGSRGASLRERISHARVVRPDFGGFMGTSVTNIDVTVFLRATFTFCVFYLFCILSCAGTFATNQCSQSSSLRRFFPASKFVFRNFFFVILILQIQ